MRVSTSMVQRLAVNSILERQSDLSRTQLQLASGRRILTPSEDPSGTTQALKFTEQKNKADQFQANIDRAQSRLEVEEGMLISIGDTMQRVRELVVQGLNDSQGADNRAAIAEEVRQRLGEIYELANATDGAGEYLFAGLQSKTRPVVDVGGGVFTFVGDQNARELQVSPNRVMATSDSGHELFFDLPYSGGGKQNIFQTIHDFAASLDANAPVGAALTDIDTAMDRTLSVRAKIGARMNALESQRTVNEQYIVQMQSNLSEVQDLDYAEAIGRLNVQLSGLQAAQQTFQKVQNLSLFNFM